MAYCVGHMGFRAYIFYSKQLPVNYCIINKNIYLFVETKKINIISQLIKSCNHPISVDIFFNVTFCNRTYMSNILITNLINKSQFKIYLTFLYLVNQLSICMG